ncbi:DUF5996 family protein [Arthrobacter sp. I2-34]|uniref:DUF5996 family protein n=1 Tax=Arthrobacter hankyongi TaxID=2904801 RepID=A0ABS9LBZ5_9MICC|nr:DUF5996 family protein [Arthrobacter hankyongi]MCG2624126.1 DUF5996 family protein [Arthrobacter hankyongi]
MGVPAGNGAGSRWPELRVQDWAGTRDTLHLWIQIVGKIRMAHAPMLNHWWQVTLYVTPRGLTTSSIPYGRDAFDMEFDFFEHVLRLRTSNGTSAIVQLSPKPVAEFYAETFDALGRLGIKTAIRAVPNEVEPAIPFTEDYRHASYDSEAARLLGHQLIQADRVLNVFRSYFRGKVSPVHFFWGGMDLACTRFSGRPAPTHPGGAPNCADWVMVEGYSHELSSCGFWPGGGDKGAFYAYAYPEPAGLSGHPVEPAGAAYDQALGLYLLPYEAVRRAADPDRHLLQFLHSTYIAAAEAGHWDRAALETDPERWRHRPARDQ